MKKLAKPVTPPEYLDYLVKIRDAKKNTNDHKANLISNHNQIVQSFADFESAIEAATLRKINPSKDLKAIAESLKSCYAVTTVGLQSLKGAITGAQAPRVLKYCPMCGTTLPRTYDYYLPQSQFPEFSVHALNLIPCCAQCNSIKDDDWLDTNSNRQYLHLYSDEIPVEPFLLAVLEELPSSGGVGVVFKLKCPPNTSLAEWQLIESHFKRLHLLDRYAEQVNDEIAEILADCAIYLQEGGTNAAAFLGRMATERAKIYGESHWRVVLMRALASSPKLQSWISAISATSPDQAPA